MDTVKILEVKQSIFASNDEQAEALRKELKKKKVFLLNLMSAPGSGKTTKMCIRDRCHGIPLPTGGRSPLHHYAARVAGMQFDYLQNR